MFNFETKLQYRVFEGDDLRLLPLPLVLALSLLVNLVKIDAVIIAS